jgi:hypothetical protein
MINLTVTTNIVDVANHFDEVKDDLKKGYPPIIVEETGYIIQKILSSTPPFAGNDPKSESGSSEGGIKWGIENVYQDINRAFGTWDEISIGEAIMGGNTELLWNINNPISWNNPLLEKAWMMRDLPTLQKAFGRAGWTKGDAVKIAEVPTISMHKGMRNPQTGAIKDEIKHNKAKRVFVRNQKAIDDFAAVKISSVGKMGNGWIKCLNDIGASTSSWIDMANGEGGAKISGSEFDTKVEATNNLGDFNGMLSRAGTVPKIMAEGQLSIQRRIEALLHTSIMNRFNAP